MAQNEQLYQFPLKNSPLGADILYAGDSTNSFNAIKIAINTLPINVSQLTGTVSPANNGTGVSNPTVNSIPIAQSGSNFNFINLTNGQLLIGNNGNVSASTLTAGTNVSIVNTPGNITISASGSAASGQFLRMVFITQSGTYNPGTNANSAMVVVVGSGGGGCGTGAGAGTGSSGQQTSFITSSTTLIAGGGQGGGYSVGGLGGMPTGTPPSIQVKGGNGNSGFNNGGLWNLGGAGGRSLFGGAGGFPVTGSGNDGQPFSGGGGSAGGTFGVQGSPAAGGGAGATVITYISPITQASVTIQNNSGVGGEGGTAGTGGYPGGDGATGCVVVF